MEEVRWWLGGVTTNYTYDPLNELTTSTDGTLTTYGYDFNGNRTTKSTTGSPTTVYSYDTSNRLTSASTNGTTVFTATYDARDRRLYKDESGTDTAFRYDGGTSIEEHREGELLKELIRAGGLGGGIGSVLYSDMSGATPPGPVEYFAYDAVGNTVALTDTAGATTQTTLYDAFGGAIMQTGTSDNNRLHNTKERDQSIGLDDQGFRYYDPQTGSFVQRDPSGYGDGLNVYLSVHDNPINDVDPQGLEDKMLKGREELQNQPMSMGQVLFPTLLGGPNVPPGYAQWHDDVVAPFASTVGRFGEAGFIAATGGLAAAETIAEGGVVPLPGS